MEIINYNAVSIADVQVRDVPAAGGAFVGEQALQAAAQAPASQVQTLR